MRGPRAQNKTLHEQFAKEPPQRVAFPHFPVKICPNELFLISPGKISPSIWGDKQSVFLGGDVIRDHFISTIGINRETILGLDSALVVSQPKQQLT